MAAKKEKISTHTPLAGCNYIQKCHFTDEENFYSHTPCGVQRKGNTIIIKIGEFLLTHPLRGATIVYQNLLKNKQISTHTPLAGCNGHSDKLYLVYSISTHTPLAGCNRLCAGAYKAGDNFYSHTPCGVQRRLPLFARRSTISTHTPLAGCNAYWVSKGVPVYNFYSHTPCGVQPQNNVFYCKLHTI